MRNTVMFLQSSATQRRWGLLGMLVLLLGAAGAAGWGAGRNWPGWRGDGTGISAETDLPVAWTTTDNVLWKAEIPGLGYSSPVVYGNNLFLTAAEEKGSKRKVYCLDAHSGAVRWSTGFDDPHPGPTNVKNQYASPTPVTDGRAVYAFFDAPGLVALDMQGHVRWTTALGPLHCGWGQASSPVLVHDLVVLACDTDDGGFIVGVDKATGAIRWKTPRAACQQFSTPLIYQTKSHVQAIVNGNIIAAYDVESGAELWRCNGAQDTSVTPSIITGPPGIVYVAAARNGPVFAIDPSGSGDVSATHLSMLTDIGGPYVPSPLYLANLLLLPGDDGVIRLLDAQGHVVLKHALAGRFSASPVYADGKIYWNSEKGDIFVLDATKLQGAHPVLPVLAVNKLADEILASPAVANKCVYIRTAKTLYCLAKRAVVQASTEASKPDLPADFDGLKAVYDLNVQTDQGGYTSPQAYRRLQVVEAMGDLRDPRVAPFLIISARKDNDWDVRDMSARALGKQGEAATPQLIALMLDATPGEAYLIVTGADDLAQLQAEAAVPALVTLSSYANPLVRAAVLRALGSIAAAHRVQVPTVTPVIIKGLADPDATVKDAACNAAVTLREVLEGQLPAVRGALQQCAQGTSAESAKVKALLPRFADRPSAALYGVERVPSVEKFLTAGPVRMKYQDGELRYLYVGNTEIARRVYFSVRDPKWGTAVPLYDNVRINDQKDHFDITLTASYQHGAIQYRWTGTIVGKADGTISYQVDFVPKSDFETPRTGICLLFGAQALKGTPFRVTALDGAPVNGIFPVEVTTKLLAGDCRDISYARPDGLRFRAAISGGVINMEDQRSYCDSAFKAYTGIDAIGGTGKNAVKGAEHSETLTISVANAHPLAVAAPDITTLTIMNTSMPGAKMPALSLTQKTQSMGGFYGLAAARPADTVNATWDFTPHVHLADEDAFFENITSPLDQAATVHAFAPSAVLHLVSAGFNTTFIDAGEPRVDGQVNVAWIVAQLKYFAQVGMADVAFNVGDTVGPRMVNTLAPYSGCPLLPVVTTGRLPVTVETLAISQQPGKIALWLVNTTDRAQTVRLPNAGTMQSCPLTEITVPAPGVFTPVEKTLPVQNGLLTITLKAYQVVRIMLPGKG
jgi:outer membrane protein assembly factor BamB